jgi:hypothetical protein
MRSEGVSADYTGYPRCRKKSTTQNCDTNGQRKRTGENLLFRGNRCLIQGEYDGQADINLIELSAPVEELLTVPINDTTNTLFITGIAGLLCHLIQLFLFIDLIFTCFFRLHHVTWYLAKKNSCLFPLLTFRERKGEIL